MKVRAVSQGTLRGVSILHGNIIEIDERDFDARWMERLASPKVETKKEREVREWLEGEKKGRESNAK